MSNLKIVVENEQAFGIYWSTNQTFKMVISSMFQIIQDSNIFKNGIQISAMLILCRALHGQYSMTAEGGAAQLRQN